MSKPREKVPQATSVEGGTAARTTPMGIEPEVEPKKAKSNTKAKASTKE